MENNPYESPQKQPEKTPPQRLWRRLLSDLLGLFGLLLTFYFVLMIYITFAMAGLSNGGGIDRSELRDGAVKLSEKIGIALGLVTAGMLGPAILLAALAVRRAIYWRYVGLATLVILGVIVAYLMWWWPHVKSWGRVY